MSLLISLIIFGFSLYLFMVTVRRIKQLEDGAVDSRFKKEMENLIVEFNAAATRNIALLEEKIEVLQNLLQKANQKIIQLDEKIDRVQRPVVIEKVVEKSQTAPGFKKEISSPLNKNEDSAGVKTRSREEQIKQLLREGKTREEILRMGFFENEINLIEFLYKNEIK